MELKATLIFCSGRSAASAEDAQVRRATLEMAARAKAHRRIDSLNLWIIDSSPSLSLKLPSVFRQKSRATAINVYAY
jgi:hypothetical protein